MSKKVFDSVIINHERVRLTRGNEFIYCHDAADIMNDMLEALQELLLDYKDAATEWGDPEQVDLSDRLIANAEAAIAKALGEDKE